MSTSFLQLSFLNLVLYANFAGHSARYELNLVNLIMIIVLFIMFEMLITGLVRIEDNDIRKSARIKLSFQLLLRIAISNLFVSASNLKFQQLCEGKTT